ncbi:MAG: efflux RND transporter periplasmic adaptor subunit, partial [Bacteroidetes bacterium]|nr:efflux RND transporter periplasmic adaptor subunit [Bacteroidota bacterium]
MNPRTLILTSISVLLFSCGDGDAGRMHFTGIIDANTVRVSAETPGRVVELLADEGSTVTKGDLLARIETERIGYQLEQTDAQKAELAHQIAAARARIEAARIQRENLAQRFRRFQALLKNNAVTQQAVDDLQAQLSAADAEITSAEASLAALRSKETQLSAGQDIVRKQLRDAEITAPLDGHVLVRYTEVGELLGTGSPVFEIADLTALWTRIYVSETQLPHIRLGQEVQVSIDGTGHSLPGSISWISESAEFTPKTILTEETRTS